ncbi:dTMP kinase [Kitasatospora sp. NPDC101447]|uniref:dTMP kinase n=1 Tax=Kitasatospora sp. NPDC101447 TaxID=3364102 RepID=UPI003806CAF1
MALLPLGPRAFSSLQRVLLVALLAPVLLITVLATVPALVVLPFLRDGNRRTASLLRSHTDAAAALLAGSRTDTGPGGTPATARGQGPRGSGRRRP